MRKSPFGVAVAALMLSTSQPLVAAQDDVDQQLGNVNFKTSCNDVAQRRFDRAMRYPEGGGLQSDLEALERMTADPVNAAEILASLCPVVFRSHFAALVQVDGGRPRVVYTTTLAPELPGDTVENFSPFDRTHRIDLPANWTPGWGETTVVVTPRALVLKG